MTSMHHLPTLLLPLFLSLLLLSRFILRMSKNLTLLYMLFSPKPPLSLLLLILFSFRNHGTGTSESMLRLPKETRSQNSLDAQNIRIGRPSSPPDRPPGPSSNSLTSSPTPASCASRVNQVHTPSWLSMCTMTLTMRPST